MKRRDFTVRPGERFGRLVVVREKHTRLPSGRAAWAADCTCDCGGQVTVLLQNLKSKTRSCGCMKRKGSMSETFAATRGSQRQFSVSPGQRFDRLTVEQEFQRIMPSGQRVWAAECVCDCGRRSIVTLQNLKAGQVRSCGCLQSERAAAANALRSTHGISDHPYYSRWRNMMSRCYDPKDPRYKNWGARGIAVCPEWHDPRIFVTYLEEVLGPCPDGHSVDRVDNNGNYEPGNVRWADPLTQRHNQRRMSTRADQEDTE